MAEYDVAIEYIFGLMKDGTLKVGDKLPTERAIAAELGICLLYTSPSPRD